MFVRFDIVASFQKTEIQAWAKAHLAASATTVSDGLRAFGGVTAQDDVTHQAHVTGKGKKAAMHPQFRWVNTLLGNLKTSMSGTYHAFDFAKYASRYLAEFQFRFNRRLNLAAMVLQLISNLVQTMPQPLRILRVSEVGN